MVKDTASVELADKLLHWLAGQHPARENLQVSSFTTPAAGASNETLLFDVSWQREGKAHTQALVASAFLLPDVAALEIISRNSAGAVTSIKGIASDGSYKILRGDTFRSRAKIPSPYFSLAAIA